MENDKELKEAREWLDKNYRWYLNHANPKAEEETVKVLLAYHRYREEKNKAEMDTRIYEILGYVSTVGKKNTDDWMRRLVEILNKHLSLMKDSDILVFNGDGLTLKRSPQPPKE